MLVQDIFWSNDGLFLMKAAVAVTCLQLGIGNWELQNLAEHMLNRTYEVRSNPNRTALITPGSFM
jgi:hypothetical protein